jgi:HK97 family phage prohead protease
MADTSAVERRYTPVIVQVRDVGDGKKRIGGYAAVFNRLSRNLGGFVEQVGPAFFNAARAAGWPDVMARYNHDDNMLLGTTGAGTLSLQIDDQGLSYTVDPPASRGDVLELVSRGDVRKSSFAFMVPPKGDEWSLTDQGYPMRTLQSNGVLVDVAPVNMPAYTDSSAGLRSLASRFEADFEEVRSLAAEDGLKKFFVRTDQGIALARKRTTFAPLAMATLMARREDPSL